MTTNLKRLDVELRTPRPATAGYLLITPARNEVSLIEATIQSVVRQTVKPLRWMIVSDGSDDGTDEIVLKYAAEHAWVQLLRLPAHRDRHFAAKATAFKAGLDQAKDLDYAFVVSLDADITFEPDYFEFLLGKLAENPKLGLVGTPFAEQGVTYDYRYASTEHVSGACQMFRRECFEDIGGYVPIKSGGIDLVAVLTARMKGWQVQTFLEKNTTHHRKQGSASRRGLAVVFNDGRKDYLLGSHPLWEVLRVAKRMTKRPYLVGGLTLLSGYVWLAISGTPKTVSPELMAFRRNDQKIRLRALFGKIWK
jgi:glycosyltransferase involved in cell wall biosynthesis